MDEVLDRMTNTIRFEDDFIYRNCRSVTSTPDIALTELVANSWDAGAYNVSISIPEKTDEEIIVEDDGIGMDNMEFNQRWQTLSYNRQKRQGRFVEFPSDVEKYVRVAYGRNGIGRHGMLCFSNNYSVETWKNGLCYKYSIAVTSGNAPFNITEQTCYQKEGHGTKISTYVHNDLPNIENMTDIISARFLYDPRFTVAINGKTVELSEHKGLYEQSDIVLENGIKLHLDIIDSTKTARKSQQHGIAFWVCGRLVGSPSWNFGNFQFLDGRVKIAKRYTIVAKTEELVEEVLPDWTGVIDSLKMKTVYMQFKSHVDKFINSVMFEQIQEVQLSVIEETRDQLENLPIEEKREISAFIEEMTEKNPVISEEALKLAVEAVISIERSRKGEKLLAQLGKMSPEELDKLSDLLDNWDIDDILTVLGEIDRRIVVVEAISRLQSDKSTDELHTLHPLVLGARWLFGAEFDSPMYVSNVALSTVVKSLFNGCERDLIYFSNARRRPDIVVLKDYSINAVCTDRIDSTAGKIMKPDQVLLLELKRGGFEISSSEVAQAEDYVRQIKKSGVLHKDSTIHAFVVGSLIGDVDTHKETNSGIIDVVSFGQLVETANSSLFRLKDRLQDRYDTIGDETIVEMALKKPKQMKIADCPQTDICNVVEG